MARNKSHPKAPSPKPSSDESGSSEAASDSASSDGEKEVSLPSPSPSPTPTKKPKQTPAAAAPPAQSDSESGDDEEDSDEEEEEEEAPAPTKAQAPPPLAQPTPKPTPKPVDSEDSDSASGSEDEDDSESEEEEAPQAKSAPLATLPDPASIKPISSKPMDEPAKPKKPSTLAATPADESDKKKRKAPEAAESGDQKKQLFQRIFSPKDEIAILKGMADYRQKKGIVPTPTSNMSDFHDFVQPSLSITINKNQLSEKVRRLKKKFDNAVTRAKSGKDPQFRNPDDQSTYEISKRIWGANMEENDADGGADGDTEMGNLKAVVVKEESGRGLYSFWKQAVVHMDNGLKNNMAAMRAAEAVDPTKARVLEEKLKKQRVLELKHHLQRMELLKESVKLIADGLAKSG